MKLIYCAECGHTYSLTSAEERSCSCGTTRGRYIDFSRAWYAGPAAVPLGFVNWTFQRAIDLREYGPGLGTRFDAFVVPVRSPTYEYRKEA